MFDQSQKSLLNKIYQYLKLKLIYFNKKFKQNLADPMFDKYCIYLF